VVKPSINGIQTLIQDLLLFIFNFLTLKNGLEKGRGVIFVIMISESKE
jgi:hypothetical protein